jgi:hypothetical protein
MQKKIVFSPFEKTKMVHINGLSGIAQSKFDALSYACLMDNLPLFEVNLKLVHLKETY